MSNSPSDGNPTPRHSQLTEAFRIGRRSRLAVATVAMMLLYWSIGVVFSGYWLHANLSDCGPGSEPECGIFDGLVASIFAFAILICLAGLLLAIGVWKGRFGALVGGIAVQTAGLCEFGALQSWLLVDSLAWTIGSFALLLLGLVIIGFLFVGVATHRRSGNEYRSAADS